MKDDVPLSAPYMLDVELENKWFSSATLSYQPSFSPNRRSYSIYECTICYNRNFFNIYWLDRLLHKKTKLTLIYIRPVLSDFPIFKDYFSWYTDRHCVEYFYVNLSHFGYICMHSSTHSCSLLYFLISNNWTLSNFCAYFSEHDLQIPIQLYSFPPST